jgi:hypothetical protein
MARPLNYRLSRPADVPALSRLWAEDTEWGELSPDKWRQWFVDTPHGACPIVVAETARGELVGQLVFTPTVVQVGGQEVRALRMSAPIVRKDYRASALVETQHPAIMLWLTGAIAGAARGYRLIYNWSEKSWVPFFRTITRFRVTEFRCLAAPLLPNPVYVAAAGSLAARPVCEFGPEHEALWQSARELFPLSCGVKRTVAWLRYRHASHKAVEVREPSTGRLVGYACVNGQTGLLSDVVARGPAELAPVLAATLLSLVARRQELDAEVETLKVMEIQHLQPALRELEFAPHDFRYGFITDALDPDLDPATVAPEAWYAMPSD